MKCGTSPAPDLLNALDANDSHLRSCSRPHGMRRGEIADCAVDVDLDAGSSTSGRPRSRQLRDAPHRCEDHQRQPHIDVNDDVVRSLKRCVASRPRRAIARRRLRRPRLVFARPTARHSPELLSAPSTDREVERLADSFPRCSATLTPRSS